MVVVNEFIFSNILVCKINLLHKKKDYDTLTSQVVTHPSTTQARICLTTEIGRDPVFLDEIRCFYLSMVVVNEFIFSNILLCKINLLHKKKDYNTWTSQVVTHHSTTQARRCLTTEIGRDPMSSS